MADEEKSYHSSNIESTRSAAVDAARQGLSTLPGNVLESPKTYCYPANLSENSEFVHSVIFYINARNNTRVGQAAQSKIDNGSEEWVKAQNKLTEQYAGENRVSSESADGVLASVGGVATAGAAYSTLRTTAEGGSPGGKLMEAGVVGTAAGVALGLASTSSTLRLLSAIELYVSAPPSTSYSAEWENAEMGALGGSLASGGDLIARDGEGKIDFQGMLDSASGFGSLMARSVIQQAANVPKEFGLSGDLGGLIEATSKKVANPYKEQLFKNMGFRKFAFQYKFVPRSESELNTVMEIIQMFKYHMHPELDPSRLFLIYPSEFNIEYRYRGERNTYVNKISTCALTDMSVTYGATDFTTFKGTKGAPSEINMSLSFSELETLTNDRIGQKWGDGY